MFANLTWIQKTCAVILIILCLAAIVLAIYFGVSKSCKPNPPTKPSFQKFTVSPTTNPWILPTYYKYSYYDELNKVDGPQSLPSGIVQSYTATNPIIQVFINTKYTIKIYRAVGTSDDFKLFTVTVDAGGFFTDTQNPYTPPPTPLSKPNLVQWHEGTPPWIIPTFYKYSYYDEQNNVEGLQSDPSDEITSTNETNPEFSVTLLSPYSIKIYRAVGKPDIFTLLSDSVDADGFFTDTQNPYTIPPTPKSQPKFLKWIDNGAPWKTPTFYKYSYCDKNNVEGLPSDPSDEIKSNTDTNPEFSVILNPPYSIRIYRAVGAQSNYSLLKVTVDVFGTFTDKDNPSPPVPDSPVFNKWEQQYR